ncbi:general secretion pathway protein GspH [Vibrio mimicus]|uniref:General secretion pathway protein GspH n=1 Tax=Vibrio mimicus TaxID=674 RepID=A0A2J9VLI4_VIBMI|nr:general secretion pathway protein GspH [Vibrio mimicus]
MHDLVFDFQVDAVLVESIESSAVSKSLITNKLRCFNIVGCSTRSVWFHK